MRPHRLIALEGAVNVRDLGGYRTEDGRTVRWRRLFRGSRLSHLTETDLATLKSLDIRMVCDLRGVAEREQAPGVADGVVAAVLTMPIEPTLKGSIDAIVAEWHGNGAAPEEVMAAIYRAFALDHARTYRQLLLRLLEEDNVPLLFHCTAGKDRTGFGAALILRLLGVSRRVIARDYLLTNRYWKGTGLLDGAPPRIRDAIIGAHGPLSRRGLRSDRCRVRNLRSLCSRDAGHGRGRPGNALPALRGARGVSLIAPSARILPIA